MWTQNVRGQKVKEFPKPHPTAATSGRDPHFERCDLRNDTLPNLEKVRGLSLDAGVVDTGLNPRDFIYRGNKLADKQGRQRSHDVVCLPK